MPCTNCGAEKVVARGLCSGCYSRLRRRGTVARKNVRNLGLRCSVEGCERSAHAKGFCHVHYDRQKHPLVNTWKLIRSRYPGEFPSKWARFDLFLREVGERPSPKHQLRRVDDAKPYSASNVQWIEPVPSKTDSYTPERRKAYAREWVLRRKYKITGEDYRRILKGQGGVCAICSSKTLMHVDHCHASGDVRGLLCLNCNRLLGYAKDNTEILRRAIAYLVRAGSK